MEVKIYREPENEGLILNEDELKAYHELTKELGIPAVVENKVPNLYQPLNSAQARTLTALCPAKTLVTTYRKSTIPVEVLKVLKFVEDNKMFDRVEVWYDDQSPDPLLIGRKFMSDEDKEKNYTWRMDDTLIARWGDCAHDFMILLDMGRERIKANFIRDAKTKKQQLEAFLAEPDMHVDNYITKGSTLF